MNRNVHDHLAEICELARKETTLSEIVFVVRLGGLRQPKVIGRAVVAGLLDKTGDTYRTTELGEKYLSAYHEVQKLLKEK